MMSSLTNETQNIKPEINSLETFGKNVFHNMDSPLTAIEITLNGMFNIPEKERKILQSSVRDLRDLLLLLQKDPKSIGPDWKSKVANIKKSVRL